MQANRENPLPLYIQVREHLRSQIESGVLAPGRQLRFEHELAEQYGVSNITVKHALRDLATEGLLVRIKRKGTFVSPREVGASGVRQRTKTVANTLVGSRSK